MVIGIEDLWGTGEKKNARWLGPDLMLVIDEVAAQIAKNVRPWIDVKVVGKSTFEKFPDLVRQAFLIRSAFRQNFSLGESDFMVVILLGGDDKVWFQLREIIKKTSDFSGITFAWRFHPKDPDKDKLFNEAIASGIKYADVRSANMDELILASNAIVGTWDNTDPYKALVAGIPAITMLFPDDQEERVAIGCPDGIPPIISTDIRWGARSANELATLLQEVKQNEEAVRLYTKTVRAKPFLSLFNPGAAERIADEVARHLY